MNGLLVQQGFNRFFSDANGKFKTKLKTQNLKILYFSFRYSEVSGIVPTIHNSFWGNQDESNIYLELYFYIQYHPFSLSLLIKKRK
jgi:hypothetical protein